MKKILLAVTAALAITSCSQNEEFEAPAQKAEINFNTAVTRAVEMNTDALKQAGFQVYAYNTGTTVMSNQVELSSSPWIDGLATYNTQWSVAGGPYYWPLTDKLQFFAYSPAAGVTYTATDKGYPKLTYAVQAKATDQKDLVIASVENATKAKNGATSAVSLAFKHALTQINIEVTKADGYTYNISSVKVAGVKGSGVFTYTGVDTGTWEASTDAAVSYDYALGGFTANTTAVVKDNALMLIPQALTDAKISISYTVQKDGSTIADNSKEIALPASTPWEFGTKILYKLTLPIDAEEIGLTATVSEWDEQTGPTVPYE